MTTGKKSAQWSIPRLLVIAFVVFLLMMIAVSETAVVNSITTQISPARMSSKGSSSSLLPSLGKSFSFPNQMIVMEQATHVAPPSLHCHDTEPNKCRHAYQYVAIGQVKCGTQTLKQAAEAHPKIKTHNKFAESHFFVQHTQIRPDFDKNLRTNYLGQLGTLEQNYTIFVDKNADPNDGYVYGEHSPAYLWGLDYSCRGTNAGDINTLTCRDKDFKPNVTNVIDRMLRVLPKETLMIATIRDPTRRAYSHFSHFGPTCPNEWYGEVDRVKCFHDMVSAEMIRIQSCFDAVGTLDPRCIMLPYDHKSTGARLVSLGLYAVFFQLWLQYFPNFCIMDVSSHGRGDLVGVARDLEQCLGLEPESNFTIDYEPVSQTTEVPPMWDITRDMLDGFYAPYNRLMCDMAPHTCDWPWVKAALERDH
mmetsp:Transcript_7876/g.13040  ORF Transcript_7876/g.13040 Transcript_7876/m.13040 type:complete len:419 (+) Transcript_7876:57-1313(+)|eukprot:CAMPEP_0119014982 /NCGR_PEP_ID=MMETSP1176-20130426/10494_1 /TAXON_ID=265551 /ORGANISM="Synedropsis recta cf, Strain CCMP1620" /LENGTH=418 /DNA_ID=CAMNT_0006968239 /DNA_START=43 /DNA_END=1299 /DNA_ORIENTATION=-